MLQRVEGEMNSRPSQISVVVVVTLLVTGCRSANRTGDTPPATTSNPPAIAQATDAGGVAQAVDAGGLARPSTIGAARDPFIDPAFRKVFAHDLSSQVERGDWGAFLPSGGVSTTRTLSILSPQDAYLADPNGPAEWSGRWCSAEDIDESVRGQLRDIAADLHAASALNRTSGFRCEKDTCELYNGEFCSNSALVFKRDGAFVRLVAVHEYCGRFDTVARPPPAPPCSRKRR
jgi:hypothetical protein